MDSLSRALSPRKIKVGKSDRRLSVNHDLTESFVFITFGAGLIIASVILSIIYYDVVNQLTEAQRNLDRALEGLDQVQLGSIDTSVPWEFLTFILIMDLIIFFAGVAFVSLGVMKKLRTG